jgi:hypothetical protein
VIRKIKFSSYEHQNSKNHLGVCLEKTGVCENPPNIPPIPVFKQDISHGPDTETGRPYANNKTLKVACSTVSEPSSMPVVNQYDANQAMRQQTLVVAYEEDGTVTPVLAIFMDSS